MVQQGATNLSNHRELINKLNVFPVPDGDTGTNMNLSMSSGVKEINELTDEELPVMLTTFVKGLLMGARGNSGVILSQLFRGVSQLLQNETKIKSKAFAQALENGVKIAYQSVTNPVEGTMLTVAKDAAKRAIEAAEHETDICNVMEKVVLEAKQSLERTPELLPILKEVGVVDSGGKGLVVIYEGFLAALKGEELSQDTMDELDMETMVQLEHERAIQSFISEDSIEYGYCTEFFVELDKNSATSFDETTFRSQLSEYGDSLLVAADDTFIKIHIHTEQPGNVMTFAQSYGQLINIDIENMRKQYASMIEKEAIAQAEQEEKAYGIIAVAMGKGLKEMFMSLGTSLVIEGGQTMNPSTEDLLVAIEKVNAHHLFILPNNKNIVMAAKQAQTIKTKENTINPKKTITQGISVIYSLYHQAYTQ